MYLRHKFHLYLMCALMVAEVCYGRTLLESIKDLVSFKVPKDIFSAVNETIVGKLQAKNIKFIVPNKVEIEGLEVLDEHGSQVLYGKHVYLSLSLWSLLTNNIRITDAFIEAPYFRYQVKGEVHNIIRLFEDPPEKAIIGPKAKSKIRVTIEKVATQNGTFAMHHDAGVVITASGIKAAGKFWVEDGPFGVDIDQATIAAGKIETGGMTFPIKDLVAKNLWISDTKVSANSLQAHYEKALIKGSGAVLIDKEKYDIKAFLDAPYGVYPQGLKVLPFAPPPLKANVVLTGNLVDPQFEATVNVGGFDFNNLLIKRGVIKTSFNQKKINITEAQLEAGTQGSIRASGQVLIDKGTFQFSSKINNMQVTEIGKFLSFDKPVLGVASADASFDGSFAGNDPNIHVVGKGLIRNGGFIDVKLLPESTVDFDVNYILEKRVQVHHGLLSDKAGLSLRVQGEGSIPKKSIDLKFDAYIPKATHYFKFPNSNDELSSVKAQGVVRAASEKVAFEAEVKTKNARLYQIDSEQIRGKFSLSNDRLSGNMEAKIHHGDIKTELIIADLSGKKELHGKATLSNIQVGPLLKPYISLSTGGALTSTLDFRGVMNDPIIRFSADVQDLFIESASFSKSQFIGEITAKNLVVSKALAMSPTTIVEGGPVSYDFASQKVNGSFHVSGLSLNSLVSPWVTGFGGTVTGPIQLNGTLSSPKFRAPMQIANLNVRGLKLGSGALTLELSKEYLLPKDDKKDLVFSVSANLSNKISKSIIRLGYALNQKTINIESNFTDVLINTEEITELKLDQFGFIGNISGFLSAQGPIRAPVVNAEINAEKYSLFDPRIRKDASSQTKTYGPLNISVFNGEDFRLDLCSYFAKPRHGAVCGLENSMQFSAVGTFNLDEFSLKFSSNFSYDHVEELLLSYKSEFTQLNAKAKAAGFISKKTNQSPHIEGLLEVEKFSASLPKVNSMNLKSPVKISFSENSLKLLNKAFVEFSPGQLEIDGSVSKSEIDLSFKGAIPIIIGRPFMPIVQGAEGLARGEISISGPLSEIILEGKITPDPGSVIIFHKWIDPVEFKDGLVSFDRLSKNSFVTKFSGIRTAVGDGRLSIDGSFTKNYSEKDSSKYSSFNLNLNANNIVFRNKLDFVELDFSINTEPDSNGVLVAQGEVIVTDGSAHQQFDLRNFVAEAKSSQGPGLYKVLDAIDLGIDLDIAVRQFKASARMHNLDIEALLRGQIMAKGPIASPKFKGELFVTEGAMVFPALSFDLMESQIVLQENSKKPFDPQIKIIATQDLDKDTFQIDQDTTIELAIRGNLDKLGLELRPIKGDMRMSQLKIFLLLLSPQMAANFDSKNQSEILKRGAQNAALVLSEVFLRPLTNELQEILEGRTKTRIQFGSAIEPGGVTLRLSWKLGPRLELQGSYMFVNWDSLKGGDKVSLNMENAPLGDLKLKLLLFDHRPLGPLFLESSFGSVRYEEGYEPRGKIRLKYRVLSK